MRVIAIDPGYDRLGIAIMEKGQNGKDIILHSECAQTSSKDIFHGRVWEIGARVRSLIAQYHPEYMAIETLFFSKNTKTALQVSESRGVVIFQAIDAGIPVVEYTPNQIKLAVTGYGSAIKKDVHFMVQRLVDLGDEKKIDDEIDAIATGITFFATYRPGIG